MLFRSEEVVFTHPDRNASGVHLSGSWDDWLHRTPMRKSAAGAFSARVPRPAPGRHAYKFLVVDSAMERWVADGSNSARMHDGYGGYNSVLQIPETGVSRRGTSGPG